MIPGDGWVDQPPSRNREPTMPPKQLDRCANCDALEAAVAKLEVKVAGVEASVKTLSDDLRADLKTERKQNLWLMLAALLLVAGGSDAAQGLIKLALALVAPGV